MATLGSEIVNTVNKLQDVFTSIGSTGSAIDLPQICVLGSQSSGKSSVLENIVGRDFLPRGTGIVTRRPLVLQLIHRPAGGNQANGIDKSSDKAANPDEWGEFLHLPGQKIYDFHKIRDEIVRDTEAKTGKNAGISPQPINLRIFSPNVLTLTLVDLPGLTKVPVGDQPKDIERQIRDMLLKYISKPSCIILAVTAANTDLANSDGLKMAREVDPEGTRTIGVLTKVDLMDKGTNVVDILAGRIIPLRLGYVPVVNRGQHDIESNKPIQQALDAEREFFETHPSYSNKAQFCGTPFLSRKLNMILMHHIRATLPDIKARISSNLQKYNAELQSLGGTMGDNSANIVLSTITEFCGEFRTVIDGNTNDLSVNELSGGARISFVFHELFNTGIKTIDPFDQVKDGDIRTILYNSSGSTPSLFVATSAFEVITKQQIKRLEEPSVKCCQLVYDELIRILGHLLGKVAAFKRFPLLRERFNAVVVNFFKSSMNPTVKLVTDMVAMQACYINTTHPDFIGGHKAFALVTDKLSGPKPPPGPAADPKQQRAQAINNNKDLDVEVKRDEGFFGSFFSRTGAQSKKKGAAAMEAPPPSIRPQAALSDRETMETDLMRNPTVMRKLQDEVRRVAGDKLKVAEEDLSQMHYLKAVTKEVLRLRIPAPVLLPRETTTSFSFRGYHIPAKTRVCINAWAIARDPKTWEAPEEFRPERFLDSSVDFRGNDFQFLPFGAGRRMCPGINFAMATNEIALANLVHRFDWELPGGMNPADLDMEEAPGLTTPKKVPLCLVATPWTSCSH